MGWRVVGHCARPFWIPPNGRVHKTHNWNWFSIQFDFYCLCSSPRHRAAICEAPKNGEAIKLTQWLYTNKCVGTWTRAWTSIAPNRMVTQRLCFGWWPRSRRSGNFRASILFRCLPASVIFASSPSVCSSNSHRRANQLPGFAGKIVSFRPSEDCTQREWIYRHQLLLSWIVTRGDELPRHKCQPNVVLE